MEKIKRILDSGTSDKKIKKLESISSINNAEIVQKIISMLDDDDIQVRGEAFSSLLLNKNEISDILIKNLRSTSKNIRGFTALVLANRNESNAIQDIIKLTHDQHSMVRACALGALGHLKATAAKDTILNCLLDSDLEVRKSALQAVINIGCSLSENRIKEISIQSEPELERLLSNVKRKSGPKGI